MPVNKTVTFDASQWQLVPKVPTEDMVSKAQDDAPKFLHGDPWYGSEEVSDAQARAVYAAMLAIAPTPAAQSAGQEAVSGFVLAEIGRKHFGNPIPKAWYAAARHLLREYAAPVNGGERKKSAPLFMTGWQLLEALDLVAPDRATDPDQMDEEIALQMGDETCHSGPGLYAWEASEPDEGSTFLAGERAAIAANQAKGGA